MSRRGPIRCCLRCGRDRRHEARGLCVTCYHAKPYEPTGTGRGGVGVPRDRATLAGRMDDFAELRRWGLSVHAAARRLGIALRTAWRYEARLKNVQPGCQAPEAA